MKFKNLKVVFYYLNIGDYVKSEDIVYSLLYCFGKSEIVNKYYSREYTNGNQ